MGMARESTWTSLRSMPSAVWLLYVAALVNRFGNSAVVFLVFHLRSIGLSSAQAGLVLTAYGLGGLFSSVVGGALADRYSRQGVIAGSAMFACVGFLVLGQVHDYPVLLMVSVATGFMAEMYRPAANALVADLVEPGRRVAAFAGYRLFTNAGFAVGPAIGGLVTQVGSGQVFDIAAVCCLCYAGLVLFGVRGTTTRTVTRGRAGGSALAATVRDRRFLVFLVGYCVVMFLLMQYQAAFPLFTDEIGMSQGEFGLLVGLNGALVVLLSIPAVAATSVLRSGTAIGIGFLLTGVGFGLNAFAAGMVALAVAVAIATVGEVVFMPHAAAHVAEIAPLDMRARYMSALESAWSLSLVISPSIGIALYEMSGRSFWLISAGLGAGAAVAVLLVHRLPGLAVPADEPLQVSTQAP
jgi:MFS family permease